MFDAFGGSGFFLVCTEGNEGVDQGGGDAGGEGDLRQRRVGRLGSGPQIRGAYRLDQIEKDGSFASLGRLSCLSRF